MAGHVVGVAEAARGDPPLALELLDVARLVTAVFGEREHLHAYANRLRAQDKTQTNVSESELRISMVRPWSAAGSGVGLGGGYI